GAINAACVVGARSLRDARLRLNAIWDDLTLNAPAFWPHEAQRDLSLFGLPGFYTPRIDYMTFARWTSFYDTSPVLPTLENRVDFVGLNGSTTLFTISAVDGESGELCRFCNHGPTPTTITPKHILASGSLPPQFPWVELGGRHYWDGGLVNNTPFGDAIS